MANLKLKPCPWCKCEAEIRKRHPYAGLDGIWFVYCKKPSCVVLGPFSSKEKAAKEWNRRAHE